MAIVTQNTWKAGILGLVVGDALGVPVEFTSRAEREVDPVTGMRAYGTQNQPAGTWSDDSSMVFATLDSINQRDGIDYQDIMEKFSEWCYYGEYTPFHEVFDIGITVSRAISRYDQGTAPVEAGGDRELDNGNGSLMRILPVCLHLYNRQKVICTSENESIYTIHNVSALTHAHLRSQMACGFYYFMVKAVLGQEGKLISRLQSGIDDAYSYYRQDFQNRTELENFTKLADLKEFCKMPEGEIKSSGYVIDTLEVAVWCLITTESFDEAVLKAVNLGDDTDTVGAVTGGLAGLYYGYDAIPTDWIQALQKLDWIEELLGNIKIV